MTVRSRRVFLVSGLAVLTGGVLTNVLAQDESTPAAASPASPSASPDASPMAANELAITIENYKFDPPMPEIAVGTTVTWTNKDIIPHNVISKDGVFESPTIGRDDSFSFTFETAGVFPYLCTFHTSMQGEITVR